MNSNIENNKMLNKKIKKINKKQFLEEIKEEKKQLEKNKYTTTELTQLGYLIENLNRIKKLHLCILEDIINYFDYHHKELEINEMEKLDKNKGEW